jgi:Ras-related protein Rab-2A
VGKSNILSRFIMGRFNPEHEITIGCEFMAKNIQINERNVRIQIWDTAGQESYRSITRSYYKSSTCAFIIYDVTDKKSFTNISSWLDECREMCYKDMLICLVGNKIDLEDKRVISKEEGQKFADDNGLLFFETSAKTGTNIEEIFNKCTSDIVSKIESGAIVVDSFNSGIKIGKYPNKEIEQALVQKKKGCC